MQKRGIRWRVGGREGLGEKREKPPHPFEPPSKPLRNITLTTRLQHAQAGRDRVLGFPANAPGAGLPYQGRSVCPMR